MTSLYPSKIDTYLTLPPPPQDAGEEGRRIVTPITGSYQVLPTDVLISVGAITSPITISMPIMPSSGDTYYVKDASGLAGTYSITILGNGINIDGASSYVMSNNEEAIELTFNGSDWSIL